MTELGGFTHLRVHSHYSLLQALPAVPDLVAQAAADGLTRLALTDFHALYGAVAFARACRAAGIAPIVGLTVRLPLPVNEVVGETAVFGDLVLLAKNRQGYRSLCALSSSMLCQPNRDRHALHLSWEALKAHHDGLICLTGGRRGWLYRLIQADQLQAASRLAARLGGIFFENCYLSLELHDERDTAVARQLVALGERFGMPPVAVQPVYVLKNQHQGALRLLAAIDHNCYLEDVPPHALPYEKDIVTVTKWLPPAEVAARFADFPEAVANVGKVAAQCGDVLPDGRSLWPTLSLPDGQTPDEALLAQAEAGLAQKVDPDAENWPEYKARLAHETAVIQQYGFAPLFLIVADIAEYARQQNIPMSTRGSVANSLVAYAIGITTVDPVAHDLLFERFLNPARSSLPDIDLDFCSRRRDEVLDYVRRKYGEDRVALVATISTMQPKSAVRETAKAFGFDEARLKKVMAKVPRGWHPHPEKREMETLMELAAAAEDSSEKIILEAAAELVSQPHHLSVHPGGVVITPGPLTDTVPVQLAPKGFLITQFDHTDVEAIGLPKLDLLGIRALTVLADAADLIRGRQEPGFRLDEIPMADEETAVILSAGQTIGVFQCESTGAQRTLRQLRAKNVRDLAVANAFFKPGPATGGMAAAFVRRYRGEERVSYMHPALEPVFRQTMGVMLFQEQVLRVATEVAGLSWADADLIRKGMSKFQGKQMARLQARFEQGCQEKSGFTPEQAAALWQQVMAFAGYGFNQGHATAYADISYRSAYLKAHFPAEFLCARLQGHGGFHHPVIYLAEARRLGIGVRPPHVNVSARKVVLANGEQGRPCLWLGLGQVRDLRRSSVRAIVAARRERPFTSLRDLLTRVPLQAKEVVHLVQCGALDGLGESRAALLAEAEEVARAGSARQMSLFVVETAVPPETPAQRIAWEKHILGWPVGTHPLDLLPDNLRQGAAIRDLATSGGRPLAVVGVRLPGWTGGRGFFLDDGRDFVVVSYAKGREISPPKVWEPVVVYGRFRCDEWGGCWLEAERIEGVEKRP
jgi:DNA-directed DNA polymerase III PolC